MIENKIKDIIITRYGSVSNFCKKINVPYTTIDSILKRGIGKANVLNVLKICDELGLSIDSLKDGIIEPTEAEKISSEQFMLEFKQLLSKTNASQLEQQHLINNAEFILKKDDN